MGKSSTTHRKFLRKKNVPTKTCRQNHSLILPQSLCDGNIFLNQIIHQNSHFAQFLKPKGCIVIKFVSRLPLPTTNQIQIYMHSKPVILCGVPIQILDLTGQTVLHFNVAPIKKPFPNMFIGTVLVGEINIQDGM